jgi:hypothetical protein
VTETNHGTEKSDDTHERIRLQNMSVDNDLSPK